MNERPDSPQNVPQPAAQNAERPAAPTPNPASDFKYKRVDGGIAITGTRLADPQTLAIPAEIDGEPVVAIDKDAFLFCGKLTSVVIPPSVKTIGKSAFGHCRRLTSVVIPPSVQTIGYGAVDGCDSLTRIDVAEANPNFKSVDGTLTTKDGETLIRGVVSPGGSGVIPDGVKKIGERAFWFCGKLRSVVIPNGVKNIGEYAFWECKSLTSVVIPASVETIGRFAFGCCSPDSTLRGVPGSAAERWAKENGIRFEPLEPSDAR